MDPTRDLVTAIQAGIFQGRVIGYLRHNQGVVCQGLAGPQRVMVPMRFFRQRPMKGEVLTYAVKIMRSQYGIATTLVTTDSMPANPA